MSNIKLVPAELKSIQPYMKIAEEHEKRDPYITYWCRFYALQFGLKSNVKSPEVNSFFMKIMDWLENEKKSRPGDEIISSDVVAQAHIENYALKLFLWADNEDRAGKFNKNVVKAFYTAGFLYDLVNLFGESSDEVAHHRKYAKWKSTYIHNCLKNGIVPTPGPVAMEDEEGSSYYDTAVGYPSNEQPSQPQLGYPSNEQPSQPQLPYPPGGLFNISGYQPEGLNLPQPGTHAPPTTPNGSSQISPTASTTEISSQPEECGESGLKTEDIHKAQKYCKFVNSALQYEDVPAAILYLQKALKLLTTGEDD